MADFCYDCCEKTLGVPGDKNDLKGLTTPDQTAMGIYAECLCEGCGFGLFDHTGTRVRDTNDLHKDEKGGEKEDGNVTRSPSG